MACKIYGSPSYDHPTPSCWRTLECSSCTYISYHKCSCLECGSIVLKSDVSPTYGLAGHFDHGTGMHTHRMSNRLPLCDSSYAYQAFPLCLASVYKCDI